MANKIVIEKDLPIPMRDGIVLKADLYRPDGPQRLPVLLNRTPYGKSGPMLRQAMDPVRAALNDYNVLIQDCRGRYRSEGTWTCFMSELNDGYDTVEWAARQPWADGKVGTWGSSYMGVTQWLAASQAPPSLKAMAPALTASNYHDGWTYQGGAFALGFNLSWTMTALAPDRLMKARANNPEASSELGRVIGGIDQMRQILETIALKELPLFRIGAPFFFDWLDHPAYDSYWRDIDIGAHHDHITVPAFNIGGWYDIFLGGTLRNFTGMQSRGAAAQARDGQQLLVGPWSHGLPRANMAGDADFGYRSTPLSIDQDRMVLNFFDRWLKEIPPADTARVRLFVMGPNRWRDENEWPLARTDWQRFYLHSRGRANSAAGDGALSTQAPGDEREDSYVYNPLDPAPTRGGGLCCYPAVVPGGAFDQRAIENRADVLVYTTEPLTAEVEVTGPIRLTLYASSSAPDTDFTAKLVDVEPGGQARNLTDGIIRARYRHSPSDPRLLKPGEVEEYTIDLGATCNVFLAGHRIRLEISSSNFPRFDRNPNTGHELFAGAETRPALQTVMHRAGCASHLTLPVIPVRA
ncbi:MAG TPA: CocE/NonD family hydrolase [Candidatus Binataceae bacterium]